MRIELLFPHRIKSAPLNELLVKYTRYSSKFASVDLVVTPFAARSGKVLPTFLDRVSSKKTFLLSPNGRSVDTEWFRHLLAEGAMSGQTLAFAVGDAFGYPPGLETACAGSISLTPLTLPHELALVILAEQLWRALSMLHGHPYNK